MFCFLGLFELYKCTNVRQSAPTLRLPENSTIPYQIPHFIYQSAIIPVIPVYMSTFFLRQNGDIPGDPKFGQALIKKMPPGISLSLIWDEKTNGTCPHPSASPPSQLRGQRNWFPRVLPAIYRPVMAPWLTQIETRNGVAIRWIYQLWRRLHTSSVVKTASHMFRCEDALLFTHVQLWRRLHTCSAVKTASHMFSCEDGSHMFSCEDGFTNAQLWRWLHTSSAVKRASHMFSWEDGSHMFSCEESFTHVQLWRRLYTCEDGFTHYQLWRRLTQVQLWRRLHTSSAVKTASHMFSCEESFIQVQVWRRLHTCSAAKTLHTCSAVKKASHMFSCEEGFTHVQLWRWLHTSSDVKTASHKFRCEDGFTHVQLWRELYTCSAVKTASHKFSCEDGSHKFLILIPNCKMYWPKPSFKGTVAWDGFYS